MLKLLIFVLLILSHTLGISQNLDKEEALFKSDMVEALRGDRRAQSNMAYFYFHGRGGVEKDYREAFKWWKKAAEKGDALAMYHISTLYSEGKGVPQNFETQVMWLERSADFKNPIAMNGLGVAYRLGKGVPQDNAKAVEWFSISAVASYAPAQQNLGDMYRLGEGTPQNYDRAFEWYIAAARQGLVNAQYQVGDAFAMGRGVDRKDKIMAHMWFNISAGNGNELAEIARDFMQEKLTSEDLTIAQRMALKCVNSQYQDCQY